MCLSEFQNVFVQISKCICPNSNMYLLKFHTTLWLRCINLHQLTHWCHYAIGLPGRDCVKCCIDILLCFLKGTFNLWSWQYLLKICDSNDPLWIWMIVPILLEQQNKTKKQQQANATHKQTKAKSNQTKRWHMHKFSHVLRHLCPWI